MTPTAVDDWKSIPVPRGTVLRMAGLGFRPSDDDIKGDIDRLIRSIAGPSTDVSNIHLHFDELYGELEYKLAQILSREDLFFEDRAKFFGFLKVALTRHKNTIIQRYVFTEKRTGIKHNGVKKDDLEAFQDEDSGFDNFEPQKPVKIDLDDDDNGVSNYFGTDSGRDAADIMEALETYIETHLTPFESLVIHQELEPNEAAFVYAYVDHSVASQKDGKFKIRDIHKAQGLGMEINAYKKALARARTKMEPLFKGKTMNDNNELDQVRLAELQLCEIFKIQVPSHVDTMVKRRCFTIAARDNFDKVTSDVAELLEVVGAAVPKKHGDTMSCFGVLWEANHRGCGMCALNESCRAQATEVGLAKPDLLVDKRLLGTKATKLPMILPKIEPPQDGEKPVKVTNLTVLTLTDRDEEVMSFLNETMIPVLHEGEIFYRLPDKAGRRLFCVGQPERPMQLRFCNPDDGLKSELVSYGKGPMWTVPEDMKFEDVKALMNAHIANQLK